MLDETNIHERRSEPDADSPRIRRIERNSAGDLVLYLRGPDAPTVGVTLVRCFPWTLPESYISVRSADGREIVILKTLEELDRPTREVVEDELRNRTFNPKILRILEYEHEFGISSIRAETDRGTVAFQFRGRDDVRFLSPTRVLFRDVDGNTYELPDTRLLDRISQEHLNRYF